METAVRNLLESCGVPTSLLWSLSYSEDRPPFSERSVPHILRGKAKEIMLFGPRPCDIAFADGLLDVVKAAWEVILGDECAGLEFMRFDEREHDISGQDEV